MKYHYLGDGAGVPGLPAEVSDEEAAALGVTEMLQAAIANGNYQAVEGEQASEEIASSLRSSQRQGKGAAPSSQRHGKDE